MGHHVAQLNGCYADVMQANDELCMPTCMSIVHAAQVLNLKSKAVAKIGVNISQHMCTIPKARLLRNDIHILHNRSCNLKQSMYW